MLSLHGHGYAAQFLPERGGSCISLSRYGAQALRTPEAASSYQENAFLYGTPLLFFPNRLADGRFSFEERVYRFPLNEPRTGCFLHGTLHETPFEVIHHEESALTLRYTATPQHLYLTFPHAFTLTLHWILRKDGLFQQAIFTNDSNQNMPVALAFHTTFRTPFMSDSCPENLRLRLDTALEYGRDSVRFLPDGTVFSDYPDKLSLQNGTFVPCQHSISRLFSMGSRRQMCLDDVAHRLRVRYRALSGYGYWMLFNGGRPDYLCVEPQSWLSNCPNAPFPRAETGFAFIAPGQRAVYETCLSIERF